MDSRGTKEGEKESHPCLGGWVGDDPFHELENLGGGRGGFWKKITSSVWTRSV